MNIMADGGAVQQPFSRARGAGEQALRGGGTESCCGSRQSLQQLESSGATGAAAARANRGCNRSRSLWLQQVACVSCRQKPAATVEQLVPFKPVLLLLCDEQMGKFSCSAPWLLWQQRMTPTLLAAATAAPQAPLSRCSTSTPRAPLLHFLCLLVVLISFNSAPLSPLLLLSFSFPLVQVTPQPSSGKGMSLVR